MRLAVFASGGGSNVQAILDAIAAGRLAAEVVLCVSNRADAGVLARCRAADVPVFVLPAGLSPEAEAQALLDALRAREADFVALAGYLRLVPAAVVAAYQDRIVNIHPALLPAFGGRGMYGQHVHRAVLEHGVRWTGATVHLVDAEYDTGPIVAQAVVPVAQDDTPERLAARVLRVEHRLYPQALAWFAEGRVERSGRRVHIRPGT